jgi:hypothetical protein
MPDLASDQNRHGYEPYLRKRGNSGSTDAAILRQEIRTRGYPGGYFSVRNYLAVSAETHPCPPPPRSRRNPARSLPGS